MKLPTLLVLTLMILIAALCPVACGEDGTNRTTPFPAEKGVKYKTAFGAWINDMRNVDDMYEREWPYPFLDDQAEKDIINCLKLQGEAGFNIFTVWGLLVTYSWPTDIVSAVPEERKERVNRIIDAAHDSGLKVVPGVGIYSWGYNEIIKNDPEVAGTSPYAMCLSKEASWEWMKKILDFVFTEFPGIDGIHMESADLGRCHCEQCVKYGDIEYHVMINIKTADYIREKYPNKILMTSTCGFGGGVGTSVEDSAKISELSKHIDYIIVPHLTFRDENRPKYLEDFHCEFGGSSDFWIYAPQPWHRLRWFLPHPKTTGTSVKQLYGAGSSAIEYYMGPTINPSTEFNIFFGGKMLSDPDRAIEDVALETVNRLYAPHDDETAQKLVKIFFDAEDAYMSNSAFFSKGDWGLCELRITRLGFLGSFGGPPFYDGPPYYLSTNDELGGIVYMDATGRKACKETLEDILGRLDGMEGKVGAPEKIQRIRICIRNVIQDLIQLGI